MKRRTSGQDKGKNLDLQASLMMKGGFFVLNFTWNVFSQTGSVDTYLLFKELEKENLERPEEPEDELARIDFPIL
jgi:hypothetical protein